MVQSLQPASHTLEDAVLLILPGATLSSKVWTMLLMAFWDLAAMVALINICTEQGGALQYLMECKEGEEACLGLIAKAAITPRDSGQPNGSLWERLLREVALFFSL